MQATCRAVSGRDLPPSQRSPSWEFEGDYSLTIGRAYPVVAIRITSHAMYFCTIDDAGSPVSVPASAFEQLTSPIPEGWKFAVLDGIHDVASGRWIEEEIALCGPARIVDDPDFFYVLHEEGGEAEAAYRDYAAAALAGGLLVLDPTSRRRHRIMIGRVTDVAPRSITYPVSASDSMLVLACASDEITRVHLTTRPPVGMPAEKTWAGSIASCGRLWLTDDCADVLAQWSSAPYAHVEVWYNVGEQGPWDVWVVSPDFTVFESESGTTSHVGP